ncbi:alpha/beta fold hydrolase [Agromyces soli]
MQIRQTGSGRPVLLLHGAGVGGWMWHPTLDRLGTGYRAIIPDLPGFGRSSSETYPGHAPVVAELAAHLRTATSRGAVVVGFSLGAQLALMLAAEAPTLVAGTVIVSAEVQPARFRRTTLALLKATAPLARRAWFARAQARALAIPSELLEDYVRDSGTTSAATLVRSVGENLAFRLPPEWARYSRPTEVLVGADERPIMRASAALIAGAGHRDARVIAGAGHDVPFTRPDVVAAAIRACGDTAWPARSG